MNAEAWQRAKSLLADAADLPASDRERFVADRCPDLELRRELLELLASPAPLSDILAAGAAHEGAFKEAAPVPPVSGLESGLMFGSYRVTHLIDAGGMGEHSRFVQERRGHDLQHHEA